MISLQKREDPYLQTTIQSENDISSSTNQFIEKLLSDQEISQSLVNPQVKKQEQQGKQITQECKSFEQQTRDQENQSNSMSPIRNNLSNEDIYGRQNISSSCNELVISEEFRNFKRKQEQNSFSEKMELCRENFALRNSSPLSYSDQIPCSRKSTALSLYSNQSESQQNVANINSNQENEKSSDNQEQDHSLNKLKKNLFANSTNCLKDHIEMGNDIQREHSSNQENLLNDFTQNETQISNSPKNSKEKIILIQKPSLLQSQRENTNQKSNTSNIFQINQSTTELSHVILNETNENANNIDTLQQNCDAGREVEKQLFQNFQKNFNSTLADKNKSQQNQYSSCNLSEDSQEKTIHEQDPIQAPLGYDNDRIYMAFTLLMHSKSFASQIQQQQNTLDSEQGGFQFTTEQIIEELNQLDFSQIQDGSMKQSIFNELYKKQPINESENTMSDGDIENEHQDEIEEDEQQQDEIILCSEKKQAGLEEEDTGEQQQILLLEQKNEKGVDNQNLNPVQRSNDVNAFSTVKTTLYEQERDQDQGCNLNQKLYDLNDNKQKQDQQSQDALDVIKISLENQNQSSEAKQKQEEKQKINLEQSNKKGFQLSASHLNSKRGFQIRDTINLNKSLLIQLKQSDSKIIVNNQITSDTKQSKFSSTQILQNQPQKLNEQQDSLLQDYSSNEGFIYSTPNKSKPYDFSQTKNSFKKRKLNEICKYKKISPNNCNAVEVFTNQSNPWAYQNQADLIVKYKAVSSNHKQQIQVIDLRALRMQEEEEENNKQVAKLQLDQHIISEVEIQNSSSTNDRVRTKIPVKCFRKVEKNTDQTQGQNKLKCDTQQNENSTNSIYRIHIPNIQSGNQKQLIIKFGDQPVIINKIQNKQSTDLIQKQSKNLKQINNNNSQQQNIMEEQNNHGDQLKNIICLTQILGLTNSELQQQLSPNQLRLEQSTQDSPQNLAINLDNNLIHNNENDIQQSIQLLSQLVSYNHNIIASFQSEKSSQQSSVISKMDQENAQNELDDVLNNLKGHQNLQQNERCLEEYLNQLISDQNFEQSKIINNSSNNNSNNNNNNKINLKDKQQIIINNSQIKNQKEKQNSSPSEQHSISQEFKSQEKFDKLNLRHRSKRIMERKHKQSLQQQLLEDNSQQPLKDCDKNYESVLQNEEFSQQAGGGGAGAGAGCSEDNKQLLSNELSDQSNSQQQMQNNLINTKIRNKIEKNQKKVKNSKIIYRGPAPSPKTTHLAEIIMPEKYEQYLAQVGGISRSGTMCSQTTTTQPLFPSVLSKQNSNQSSFSVNEEDLQQKQYDQQQQLQQQQQFQSKAQKKAALKRKNKLTQNIEQVFYDDDEESGLQSKSKRKLTKNTDENQEDQIEDESSAGSAEQFAKCSDGSQSKNKFDTKNLVKNFLNQFLTFVQSDEEEQSIMELVGISNAAEFNEYKDILKQFFKNKKFNRALLKEFVFIVGYRKLFLYFLQNKAHNWIMSGRMKDKASHLRALQNFIYICQNFSEIKSWRFRYNFV